MLDCALISADEGFRHTVLGVLRESAVQGRIAVDLQSSAEELTRESLGKIVKAGPRIAFLDLGQNPSGIGGVQVLASEIPDAALVVAGPALSAEGLLTVMRAGATEYLPRPITQGDVLEAFQRVRKRAKAGSFDTQVNPGKVFTVFSAKGGAGVTTVATNLAIALKQVTKGKEVLVLDLAPVLGTAGVAMGLNSRYTYLDVIRNFHRIDEQLFKTFLEMHESGVCLLASPLIRSDADAVSADDFLGLVTLCRKHFDYVVVDGGTSLGAPLPLLLQESDERILVATPELPSLRNLKHAMDFFGLHGGKTPPRIVLNQYKEGFGLSSQDVEEGLGSRLSATIEKNDLRVIESVNLGRPEILSERSRFSRSILQLGGDLAGGDKVAQEPRSILSRVFGSSKRPAMSEKEAT